MGDAAMDAGAVELPLDSVLTADQLAPVLKVKPRTVTAKAKRGEIPGAFWVGDLLRFKRAVVQSWLLRDEPAGKRRKR